MSKLTEKDSYKAEEKQTNFLFIRMLLAKGGTNQWLEHNKPWILFDET